MGGIALEVGLVAILAFACMAILAQPKAKPIKFPSFPSSTDESDVQTQQTIDATQNTSTTFDNSTTKTLTITKCPDTAQPPDPCKELLQQIQEFMAEAERRYWDLRNNKGNLPMTKPAVPDPRYGTRSIMGERQAFQNTQQGLRNRLGDYASKNCGTPPADAWDWATRATPEADPKL